MIDLVIAQAQDDRAVSSVDLGLDVVALVLPQGIVAGPMDDGGVATVNVSVWTVVPSIGSSQVTVLTPVVAVADTSTLIT